MDNIWNGKRKRELKKIPVIDISNCTKCEVCTDVCPEVFKKNSDTGMIEIIELEQYPMDEVQEAIINCPSGCIDMVLNTNN